MLFGNFFSSPGFTYFVVDLSIWKTQKDVLFLQKLIFSTSHNDKSPAILPRRNTKFQRNATLECRIC